MTNKFIPSFQSGIETFAFLMPLFMMRQHAGVFTQFALYQNDPE